MQAPTYQQFRELALSQGWSVAYVAKHIHASDPVKTAERILVHLAGSRWDEEPLPYPKLCQLYCEAMGSSAPEEAPAPTPSSHRGSGGCSVPVCPLYP